MTFRLSPDVEVPHTAVTETFLIVANRGRGKSATATLLAERLHGIGQPVVVLDVKGDWWGIRSSRDGQGDGLPFTILGGEHGDLPLDPGAGTVLADAVVAGRMSVVVDLSLMSKGKARTFATDFAERLYATNRDPLHLVVEEADVLIPQSAAAGDARMLGAYIDIAKRGRQRGLGMTVVTQRTQDVAKSVTELLETMVLLGMTGRLSIAAAQGWLDHNADGEDGIVREIVASLPRLEPGDGWVISPAFLRRTIRTRFDLFATYDSHRTPEPGERRTAPQRTSVDLAALGEALAAAAEHAASTDPKALQARVRELETEVATVRVQLDAANALHDAPHVWRLDDVDLELVLDRISERTPFVRLLQTVDGFQTRLDRLVTEVEGELHDAVRALAAEVPEDQVRVIATGPRPSAADVATVERIADARGLPPDVRPSYEPDTDVRPGRPNAEAAILAALHRHGPSPQSRLAMLTGYASGTSTIRNAASKLRGRGLLHPGQPFALTDAGHAEAAATTTPLPSGPELLAYWRSEVGEAPSRVLDHLVSVWPAPSTLADAAAYAGYDPAKSTTRNAASRLRTLGLVDGWRLSADFAEAAGL